MYMYCSWVYPNTAVDGVINAIPHELSWDESSNGAGFRKNKTRSFDILTQNRVNPVTYPLSIITFIPDAEKKKEQQAHSKSLEPPITSAPPPILSTPLP